MFYYNWSNNFEKNNEENKMKNEYNKYILCEYCQSTYLEEENCNDIDCELYKKNTINERK